MYIYVYMYTSHDKITIKIYINSKITLFHILEYMPFFLNFFNGSIK